MTGFPFACIFSITGIDYRVNQNNLIKAIMANPSLISNLQQSELINNFTKLS